MMTGRGRQSLGAAVGVGLLATAIAALALTAPASIDAATGLSEIPPAVEFVQNSTANEIAELAKEQGPAAEFEPVEPIPVSVHIPDLSVKSDVVPVGVDTDNNVVVPDDIQEIGWYAFAAGPMDPQGSIVLVGHRDGVDSGQGAFYGIDQLEPGDSVVLRTSESSRMRFVVEDAQSVTKERFAELASEVFSTTGSKRLILITCGGDYVKSAGGYQENVLVTATPAPA
jgi:LPXTG-site transpeptidase (sortase) family protein